MSSRRSLPLTFALLVFSLGAAQAGDQVWYLLKPPEKSLLGEFDESAPLLFPNPPPLAKWAIEQAYDSGAQCRQALLPVVDALALEREIQRQKQKLSDLVRERRAMREAFEADPRHRALEDAYEQFQRARERLREDGLTADELTVRRRRVAVLRDELEQLGAQWREGEQLLVKLRQQFLYLGTIRDVIAYTRHLVFGQCVPSEALPPGLLPMK